MAKATPTNDHLPASVLIVDDEEDVANTYQQYLKTDYETQVATNGGEALTKLSDIDVVLLDRRMPGMSGDELLDQIHDWGTDIRVIIVSAVRPDVDLLDKRFSRYMQKPTTKEELHEAIQQVRLIDEYVDLMTEYREVVERYSVLQATFDRPDIKEQDEFTKLKQDIAELQDRIDETTEQFTNDDMKNMLGLILKTS